MKKLSLFLVMLFTVIGCANQTMQKLYEAPKDQAAFIKSSPTVLVQYVDNDPVSSGFVGQTQTFQVAPGVRTLLLEYSDFFEKNYDSHDKVVSRPVKLTFSVEAGKTYQVRHNPQPTLEQAQAFAEKPDFWVVELSSQDKVAVDAELSRPRTFLTTLKSAVSPTYEFESDQVVTSPEEVEPASIMGSMKSLWKEASEAEREAFLEWVRAN